MATDMQRFVHLHVHSQFSLLDGHAGKFVLEPLDINELLLPVAEIYTFHAQQRGGDLA